MILVSRPSALTQRATAQPPLQINSQIEYLKYCLLPTPIQRIKTEKRGVEVFTHLADLVSCEFACPLVGVNVRLFANQCADAATNATDGGKGNNYFLPAVDVGVEHTQNVLKVLHVSGAKRHFPIKQKTTRGETRQISYARNCRVQYESFSGVYAREWGLTPHGAAPHTFAWSTSQFSNKQCNCLLKAYKTLF